MQKSSKRWLVRGGAGLMIVAVIGGASPASATTGQAPTAAAAAEPMTLGAHLKALAKYGKNTIGRMRRL